MLRAAHLGTLTVPRCAGLVRYGSNVAPAQPAQPTQPAQPAESSAGALTFRSFGAGAASDAAETDSSVSDG